MFERIDRSAELFEMIGDACNLKLHVEELITPLPGTSQDLLHVRDGIKVSFQERFTGRTSIIFLVARDKSLEPGFTAAELPKNCKGTSKTRPGQIFV